MSSPVALLWLSASITMAACSGSGSGRTHRAPVASSSAGSASRSPSCPRGEPPAYAMLAAAAPPELRGALTNVRTLAGNFDGQPPLEAVLAADLLGEDGKLTMSRVGVFQLEDGVFRIRGMATYEINPDYEGTFDEVPGLKVVESVAMGVGCHELLRVEHVDVRGGVDPRYTVRMLDLWAFVDGALVRALHCASDELYVSGPARAGISTRRTIRYLGGAPPRLEIRRVRRHEPGALEDSEIDADMKERGMTVAEQEDAGEYVLRGNRYQPLGRPLCDEAERP